MVKGRSCKNPPYEFVTRAKWNSLGQTLTVKQALDKWWNSIRVHLPNGDIALIYKCYDGEYEVSEMRFISQARGCNQKDEEILKMHIQLDDEYHEDGDGYPIIYANLVNQGV